MLDDTHFLTVERSFASGIGNEINFYVAGMDGATDVTGKQTIKDIEVTPLTKQNVFKIDEGDFGLDIDNIEAITFGPEIDGARTVIIASDNNFNPVGQFSQFVAFKVTDELIRRDYQAWKREGAIWPLSHNSHLPS